MTKHRLQPTDCLSQLYEDLRRQARTLSLYDADARERWGRACADVLNAVPDYEQRCCWAICLAEAMPATRQQIVPVERLAAWLLTLTEG